MKVIIESPFAGNVNRNRLYARLSMNISLLEHGESPLAFHTIYTQCLSDADPIHRKLGIERSFPWYEVADKVVYMVDRGISTGMHDGYIAAQNLGKSVEFRTACINPEFKREVASWQNIHDAESRLNELKTMLTLSTPPYYSIHGDLTSYLLERVNELKLINAINNKDFSSHEREKHESVFAI